jgi:hypothetical protein
MKPNKELDLKQREKDAWMDVELFRLVKGRLPQSEDRLPKSVAKEFIDRFVFGRELCEGKKITISDDISKFAFHVYASTNLAYENDL